MSGRTLEKATQVVSAAQQDPEKYSHLVEKMDRKGKVDGAFRELRRLQIQNSSTETAATSLTKELFSVIFAVPPWTEAHQGDGVGGHKEQVQVLSLKEMKKLKPPIAGDAVMFVQTPASSLGSALELLAAWGFKYETFLVLTHFATGVSPWLKENHRAVLVGVQGGHRPPLPENLAPSLILQTTPVPEAAIRRCIERMFPGEKYLAVFSKIDYQGWSSWPGRAETAEKLEKATSGNPATGLT
jgi:N6-adenosine-specific RNA methylase IME4